MSRPPRRRNGRSGRALSQSAGLLLAALLGLGLAACMDTRPPTSSEPATLPAFGMASGGLSLSGELLQISQTSWTLTKTGAVDAATHTVSWTITVSQGTVGAGQLTVAGAVMLTNPGKGPATLGNVVVNLQTRSGNAWTTVASDVADATHGDAATSAHVDPHASSEGLASFAEGTGSGSLTLTDAKTHVAYPLVPEVSVAPGDTLHLVVTATFDNGVLKLAAGTAVRAEVLVSYGNASAGGSSAQDVDINGSGSIDADEANVKSVPTRLGGEVPAEATSPPTLGDAESDITTTGTVTFSAPSFDLDSTPAKASAHYDGGAEGGTIRNCAHLTGEGVDLESCDTETIAAERACTPGTVGCGWEDGDLVTYPQGPWSIDETARSLVIDYWDNVYGSTLSTLEIGIPGPAGYSIRFTGVSRLLAYLPATGLPGPLTSDLVDPTSSPAGEFGGDVAALKLNVDFSDAGVLTGSSGEHFGDLTLCAMPIPALNGTTVRQFLATVNVALGGGASSYAIDQLDALSVAISASFNGGVPSTYAQAHLFNGACPRWQDGDLITYNQSGWGSGTGASILVDNYLTVYLNTGYIFQIGWTGGFTAQWTDPTILAAYLPANGAAGLLDDNLIDATSTSAGQFGGDVASLKLNIDFADANVLAGNAGVALGHLRLCGLSTTPGLSGSTVREFLGTANIALGGGSTGYTVAELDALALQLDGAFVGGTPSTFAQDHLFNGACPP